MRVALEMGNILVRNTLMKDMAHLVQHIVKKPEQIQHILKPFFDELFERMRQRSLLSETAISVLIPQGEKKLE